MTIKPQRDMPMESHLKAIGMWMFITVVLATLK